MVSSEQIMNHDNAKHAKSEKNRKYSFKNIQNIFQNRDHLFATEIHRCFFQDHLLGDEKIRENPTSSRILQDPPGSVPGHCCWMKFRKTSAFGSDCPKPCSVGLMQ